MPSPVNSFQDLIVWQKAMALATDIYRVTHLLPKEELFGLTSQLRRAAVSIPSNIAEGQARNSPKKFLNFISIAKGSVAELITQLDLCTRLGYLTDPQHAPSRPWQTNAPACSTPSPPESKPNFLPAPPHHPLTTSH